MNQLLRKLGIKKSVNCKFEIKPLPEFDPDIGVGPRLSEKWDSWLNEFTTYTKACGITSDDNKTSLLLYLGK